MKKLGFTLIELLVVIAIIGILSALIITNIQGVRERARDARRKSDLQSIKTALRLYYNDQKSFPDSSNGNIIGCEGAACTWGSSVFSQNDVVYLNLLPLDPSSSSANPITYHYQQISDDSYIIVTDLENLSDGDIADSQRRCATPYSSYANKNIDNNYVVCE